MKCPFCGIDNPDDQELCSECGGTLVVPLGQGVDEGNTSFTFEAAGWWFVLASVFLTVYLIVDWWLFPEDFLNLLVLGTISLVSLVAGITVMHSKVWLKRVAFIVVIILVIYFTTGYLADSVKVRVTVNNITNSDMNVVIYLDLGAEELNEQQFTLMAHNQTSIVLGYVHAGHHVAEVRWSAISSGMPPSDDFNYTEHFYVMPHMLKTVFVIIDHPSG